jgi:hypothetical protein
MGEFAFRRFKTSFSSSVNSTAFFSGFICGKHEMREGYIACSDWDGDWKGWEPGQTWDKRL